MADGSDGLPPDTLILVCGDVVNPRSCLGRHLVTGWRMKDERSPYLFDVSDIRVVTELTLSPGSEHSGDSRVKPTHS